MARMNKRTRARRSRTKVKVTDQEQFGERDAYERRRASLEGERSSWIPHWMDISQFVMPRRGRYLSQKTEHNRGTKKNDSIIAGKATRAAGVASAGMKSLANKGSRWFVLHTSDPYLTEWGPVKHWLWTAEQLLYDIFAGSNFYDMLTPVFEELVCFGTATLYIEEDYQDVIRCYPFTIGSYSLALDGSLRPDTIYRETVFTAAQLVQKFGKQNVSESVKQSWGNHATEETYEIVHLIEPNNDRVVGKSDFQNMPYRSVYYHIQDEENQFLRVGGYHEFPVACPRWWITGNDVYGTAPAMVALPDTRQYQEDMRRKGSYLEKLSNPPFVAPVTMKSQRISAVPGDVTYVDSTVSGQKFEPVYKLSENIGPQLENLAKIEQAIDEAFYVDVFKMIASRTSPEMTATQVHELAGEKMILAGPVVERSEGELLDKAIHRTLGICMLANLLPPPPPELAMAGYNVKYISPLSLARLASGARSLQETVSFAAQLAEAFPGAADKIDGRQAVDEFAKMKAVPPGIMRTDEQLKEMDKEKAQQLQQQQFMENAERMAAGAKTMSETQVGDGNALEAMVTGATQ